MGAMLGCDPRADEDDSEMRSKEQVKVAAKVTQTKPIASYNSGVFGFVPVAALSLQTSDTSETPDVTEEPIKPSVSVPTASLNSGVFGTVSAAYVQACKVLPVRVAGDSGFQTSIMGLGTWQFGCAGEEDYWGTLVDQNVASNLMKCAVENGITYIDTAEVYGTPQGKSEIQVGVALKQLDLMGNVVIGTKIPPTSFAEVEKSLDASLERLGLDCVDLYMVHWPITENAMAHFKAHDMFGADQHAEDSDKKQQSGPTPTQIAFTALKKCQEAGKIKHIGVSNFGVKQMKEALSTGVKIAVNQLCYNLIFRAIEHEILPFCVENGIGIYAYSPLQQAILTGKWKSADEVPDYRWRTRHFKGSRARSRHGEDGHEELTFKTLAKLQEIADREGVPLADLALTWPLSQPSVACVISGVTKPYQIERNVRAFRNLPLRAGLVKELNDATEELKQAMGGNADLWQGGSDTRIQ